MQTTQDLIKILPFQAEFKEELLKDYDTLTDDQRYSIERVIWDLYDAIYEVRLQKNMDLAMERAKKGEEALDEGFYERVSKQTDQELSVEFSSTETTVDLSEAREELKKILKQPQKTD